MSNLTNLADFIERELSEDIITQSYGASKFLSLSTQTPVGIGGKKTPVLAKSVAGIVSTRGGKKPVSTPSTTSFLLDPVEFAVIVPFSDDADMTQADVATAVATGAIDAIAEAIDFTIMNGQDALGTAAPVNFGTLDQVDESVVTNKQEWYAALAATQKGGRSADAAVLSTGLYYELAGSSYEAGAPKFAFTGDVKSGTINGIPFTTFESATSIGYLGAFTSGTRFGIARDLSIKLLDQATITLPNSELLNLAENDMLAVRIKGSYAFNYFDEDNFRAITTEASGS